MASAAPAPSLAAPRPARPDAMAWAGLALLCAGQVISMLERTVLNMTVDPIKADLGITDTQVSLLQGFAFALFYALMAIPLGRWADRHNRRNLIATGAILFSAATFGCGLAGSFVMLFGCRLLAGAGEATLAPAGYSMLADWFPPARFGLAVGLFVGATYAGSGLSLMLLGKLLGWLAALPQPDLPLVGRPADWQLAFMLAALPGFAFAGALMALREPARSGGALAPVSFAGTGRFLRDHAATLAPIFLGVPLLAAAQFGMNAWLPTFFGRAHGLAPAEIGPRLGLMLTVLSCLGVVVGGACADRITVRGSGRPWLVVPALSALLALPFAIAYPLAATPQAALALLAPVLFFGAMPFGAGTAGIAAVAPANLRAQLMALYMLAANLVGAGGGPWTVATITDRVLGDPARLGTSLAIAIPALTLAGVAVVATGWARGRRAAAAPAG
ncbi:MAG: MFS transporter [Sphingomonadaceae bacterium]